MRFGSFTAHLLNGKLGKRTYRRNDFLPAVGGRHKGKHYFKRLVRGYCVHF